jgi:hypothetical protein
MAEDRSPWARPDTLVEVPETAVTPQPAPAGEAEEPAPSVTVRSVEASRAALTPSQRGSSVALAPRSRGGAVTRTTDPPPPDVIEFGMSDDPVQRNKMLLRWFGGAAALVVLFGVIATMIMVLGGPGAPLPRVFDDQPAPPDTRPNAIKNCPPPSSYPDPQPPPPTPPGPRTVDDESGVSYRAYGAPWEPWPMVWTGGTLRVQYKVGQHFVTERYSGGDYHASVLSASIPATNNDALAVDLRCTGRVVAADVRQQYYPNPNRIEQIEEKETRLGGRPAWVTKFRLHFSKADLDAKSELVGLALIDVGRPEAAIVYISIPDTHRQYDPVVDEVLDSVRPV